VIVGKGGNCTILFAGLAIILLSLVFLAVRRGHSDPRSAPVPMHEQK
jgi:hypothetical protein